MNTNAQTLPAPQANTSGLGTMRTNIGVDSSALQLKKPANENAPPNQGSSADSANIILDSFVDGLDTAFREAFSPQRISGDNALIAQAQKEAREALGALLTGNNLMRISPDQMKTMQDEIQTICNEIAHEALGLVSAATAAPTRNPTAKRPPADIHLALRDRINTKIDAFHFKHLGHAAKVDAEEKTVAPSKQHPQ